MKKLIITFIIGTLLTTNLTAQKKGSFENVNGIELGIIIDKKIDNTFSEYFLFQYKNLNLTVLRNYNSVTLLEYTPNTIKLTCDGRVITFTNDNNYRNNNETIYLGYGVSHRKGGSYSIDRLANPKSIHDLILVGGRRAFLGEFGGGSLTCHSGGVGSTACSADSGTLSGGGGCGVTCGTGYHACCDDTKNECRCIGN